MNHTPGSFVILLLAAAPLAAQGPSRAAPAPSTGATLAPAPAQPDAKRVAPYHQQLRMVGVRNGKEEEVGTLDDEVVLAQDNGRPAIIRIQNVSTPAGVMTDTAVADPATLAPRRHSSHGERRVLAIEFSPKHVSGTFKEMGDPSIPVDQQIGDGVFDSNMLDVLIGALPLAEGYTGRLSVYIYEAGGAVPADVAVTGSENIAGTDAWTVNVTIANHTARYSVGKADHRVAQIVSAVGPGAEMRLVRQG